MPEPTMEKKPNTPSMIQSDYTKPQNIIGQIQMEQEYGQIYVVLHTRNSTDTRI
jgi:hypothetical protein